MVLKPPKRADEQQLWQAIQIRILDANDCPAGQDRYHQKTAATYILTAASWVTAQDGESLRSQQELGLTVIGQIDQ